MKGYISASIRRFNLHNLRRFCCICLAVVVIAGAVVVVPDKTATAAQGDWVAVGLNAAMKAKYGSYHAAPGLPAKFTDYAQTASNQFYYSTIDYHALYCTEIDNHYWHPNPQASSSSPQFPNSDTYKQRLLAYALAMGQRFFGEDENSVKHYTATQIVIWIIAEGHATDNTNLDPILYPASGTPAANEGFPPTLEVGRLARKLLEDAKTFAGGSKPISELTSPIIPSFMAFSEKDAKTFTMKRGGSSYQVDLTDTNGVLQLDWQKHLKIVDSGGLSIVGRYGDDTLSVRGTPTKETTIKLTGPYGGYEVQHLSTTAVGQNGEQYQRMTRFARVDGEVPLYFNVRLDAVSVDNSMAKLNLKKTVKGGGSTSKAFKFKATFTTASGASASGILLNGKAFNNGGTLTLKHKKTAHFTNIPDKATYKIVETDYKKAGYSSNKTKNTASGTVNATKLVTVTFVNTYKSTGPNGKMPQTGDQTPLVGYLVTTVALLALATGSFFARKWWLKRARNKRAY